MYPECEHEITLRVWASIEVIDQLVRLIPLTVEKRGGSGPRGPFVTFRVAERREANVEVEVENLLSTLSSVDCLPLEAEAWIVIGLHSWSIFNLDTPTLQRLAHSNLSMSFENFS